MDPYGEPVYQPPYLDHETGVERQEAGTVETLGITETIGPIQMGLNKPIHFTDVESSTRDIVNLTTVAVVDAIVQEQIEKEG